MEERKRQQMGEKSESIVKLAVSAVVLAAMILFRVTEPAADTADMFSMIAAVLAVSVVLFRFPLVIYLPTMVFLVLAGAGSIYLMYDKLPGWDRFVHYFSGVVLGAIGYTGTKLSASPQRPSPGQGNSASGGLCLYRNVRRGPGRSASFRQISFSAWRCSTAIPTRWAILSADS